ncbi:response regulator [Roseateles oligotrophus]|uniref:Response regulator n=1 Tax=Roseateles oligotrophus TaxID=1769250 RepID=A0ABT2YGJ1_9BURK|nr:response regulator [Roseateles oligotrophus]MCV2369168.1 response regulator [Roseateles oligotrophus]
MIKRKNLVVEDERLIARDIAMQLCDLCYEPLGPAGTGEQAIEMAGELRPDLVLMDVHLGSAMDGIAAAQGIRTQFDIATAFLSAFSGDADRARAQLAKPAGYLAKPFEEHELREVIEAEFKDG